MFQRFNPHVFDIKTIFLIKTITVFNVATVPPIAIHLANGVRLLQGHVGEQEQVVVFDEIVGDQDP